MMNYIIVDDEPLAHRVIQSYAKELNMLKLKANCYDAIQAMEILNKHKIDLMFLDINMPKIKGLTFLKTLKNPPNVIITSAYEEYALEGYDLDVVDYLLKPFSLERFLKAINKVMEKSEQRPVIVAEEDPKSIFVKGDKRHHQILLADIQYLEAYGNYSKIHVIKQTILTLENLSHLTERLPENSFIRIHKSYTVSKSKIDYIEGNIVNLNGQMLPIGQTYKMNLKDILR